ncbi:AmmeMemoRadiSam system protein A [candidate division KSB1 bacterium]|nr:AmmeMemoRadiSam system protein A [candidate division KSB1 bacterium]
MNHRLTTAEKKSLLRVARETILSTANGHNKPSFQYEFPVFHEKRGAFVTLHKNKELRGCIGYIHGIEPLLDTVIEMAIAAARRDPRFKPVETHELESIDIEISVLSPLQEISDPKNIVVGTHGLYIEHGAHSGLLLPQVATEHGWDRKTFLSYTCKKAGLKENAWSDEGIRIFIFTADVFGEKELGLLS